MNWQCKIIAPESADPVGWEGSLDAAVLKVFDGDGFLANVWHPIREVWLRPIPFRFAFIDAPEMAQPFGVEARDFLAHLIVGKVLRLDTICKESTGYMPFDAYKRVLCMAFLTERMDVGRIHYYHQGKCGSGSVKRARPVVRNIELEMIINGCAWVAEQYSFDRAAEYYDAQSDARQNRRGLWATNNPEAPWHFKRRTKEQISISERQGRLF